MLSQLDCKEIYVYPFALNPEGANPSGSVNFSRSRTPSSIAVEGFAPSASVPSPTTSRSTYGVYYNYSRSRTVAL